MTGDKGRLIVMCMTEIISKIIHLASALFSIAISLLMVVFIIGTGATALTVALSIVAIGLMLYGACSYIAGAVSMLKGTEIKSGMARVGLIITIAGAIILWMN